MRKVLSIVLALAMVLGCFASVFATSYTDVAADADYATAVSVLSDLGVVSGYTDGTYQPAKTVTRAEMAALLVKALGLTPAASATTNFSDVPATHWASGYVAYANSLGIIAGYTDGTFKPSKTVSYDEAITMIISALGYTSDVLTGTWPTAYIIKADALDILDGVELLGSTGANRADIAQLIYNTLGEDLVTVNKDGDVTYTGESMLYRLGAWCNDNAYLIVGEDITAENSTIDMDKYFGAVVTAYTDGDDYIAVKDVVTEFVTIDEFDDDDFTSNWGIGADAVAFYNGKSAGTLYLTDVMDIADDTILAVVKSGSKIKTVYTSQVWEATGTFQVTDADDYLDELEDDQTMESGTYEFVVTAEDDEVIDTDSFVLVGAESLEEIAEDSVVTVYVGGGYVTKIEVSTKQVVGAIDRKSGSKWVIDGTSYSVADASSYVPTTEDEGTFYFDYAGNLFAYEAEEEESDWLFGVVFDKGQDTARYGSTTNYVKMYSADGTFVEYELDSDIDYDTDVVEGKLCAYQLDEDGVLDAITYADVADEVYFDSISNAAGATVSSQGVVEKLVIADDAKIFVNTGDVADDDDYSMVTKSSYLGKSLYYADIILDDDDEIVAAFVTSAPALTETDDVLAIITSVDDLNTDKYDYKYGISTIYGEETKSFYTDATVEEYTTAAAISGTYYTFTFDADGAVKSVDANTAEAVELATGVAITVSDAGYLKFSSEAYNLADDLAIYAYDISDEEWTVVEKLASSYSASSYVEIVLFNLDDDDEEYDVVFVIKK